jgi:hypothetical protein
LRGAFFSDCQAAACSTRVAVAENHAALWALSEQLCLPFRAEQSNGD